MAAFDDWKGCKIPTAECFEGRYAILERLQAEKHGDELYAASTQEDAEERFAWLPEMPPASRSAFQPWLEAAEASSDPLFYAVIDKRSGKVAGRQTLMRIDAANGVIETGNIFWNAEISRTPVTTEAFYLFARHIFEALGYRRFEWKCNNRNEPSKKAALRYGMKHEGVFRQHMVVKGCNRDTAWFSMLDHEWPKLRFAFDAWLLPENFDRQGQQQKRLQDFRSASGAVQDRERP